MSHGAPDDSNVVRLGPIHRVDDLAELAVRLGSTAAWDRRGDVVLTDNFEQGLRKATAGTAGTGGSVYTSCRTSTFGGYSAELIPGSDGSRYAALGYYRGLPVPARMGLEFSFTIASKTSSWAWNLRWYTGAIRHWAWIKYDAVNWKLFYLDEDGSYTEFATDLEYAATSYSWQTGKAVVDFTELEYVRFILNNQEWSLADLAIQSTADATTRAFESLIYHYAQDGENPVAYCDGVIITQNEP